MAAENTTRLADVVIVPEIIQGDIILRTLATNAFSRSGVAVRDPKLDAFLNNVDGGKTISPRFLGPLKDDDPNISTDNPEDIALPKKITGFKNTAVRQSLNQSWSVMDLTADLYGKDPMGAITAQIGDYWQTVLQRRILASLRGLIDADVAGDKDMTVDISAESGAAALFSADAFINAKGSMGDRANMLGNIAVHSTVYQTMQKQNLIDTIPNSQTDIGFGTYMGAGIIVDDGMTFVAGSPNKYYSYLFGPGAVALGVGSPKVPFEYERKPSSGNGGGEEIVYSRMEWIIHPQGYSYAKDSTPTIADLTNTANWTRAFERKRIPLAAIISQG